MHNGLSRFQWPSLTARLRREVLIWTDSGDTEIIRNSPFHSKFDVTEDIIAIEELSLIANFQYISVRVKVITGEELAIVKNRVIKQDFFITDAVESYKVVTWKENVGEISLKTKRQVRDWWYVVEDSTTKLTMDKLCNVIIMSEKFLNTYSRCYACAKKVLLQSDTLGNCTWCRLTQRLEQCSTKTSARVNVEGVEGMQTSTVFLHLWRRHAKEPLRLSKSYFHAIHLKQFIWRMCRAAEMLADFVARNARRWLHRQMQGCASLAGQPLHEKWKGLV